MIPQPPSGQGPIDPRGAFSPPPAPGSPQQGPPAGPAGPSPFPGNYGPPGGYPTGAMQGYPPGGGFGPGGFQQGGMPPGGFPPGGMRPMPYPPYPPYPPPRRSVGRMLFRIAILIVLAFSIIANILLLASNFSGSGGYQTVITAGNSTDKVVVVPITGVIGDRTYQRFEGYMKRVEEDANIKAIVLRVDTPGGTVNASDEIYNRILRYKRELKEKGRTIPIIVSMGGFATSGGYYASCAGDYLFAENTTVTGNIGVLWPNMNFSKFLEKWGVEDTTIVSSGTPFKDAGSSTVQPTKEQLEYMQHLIDVPFQRFKDVVSAGRGSNLKKDINQIANGKAYTADDAKTLGLVDDIGYLDTAIEYAIKQARLSNPQVVKYTEPPSLFSLFGQDSDSRFRGPSAGGVTIHVDASAIDRLTSPQMMYLYRGPQGGQ